MENPCFGSLSSSTQFELMRILFDNAVRAFGCAMLCKVIVFVYLYVIIIWLDLPPSTLLLCLIEPAFLCSFAFYFFVFVNLALGMLIKHGWGGRACMLCRTRVMVYFLKLHYFDRSRIENVLLDMEDELQGCALYSKIDL